MRRALIALFVVVLAAGLPASAWALSQARVIGSVVDTEGQPVAGAVITVSSDDAPDYAKQETTDAKGEFRILLLDATRTYRFRVAADGYLPTEVMVKAPTGDMNHEVTFELVSQAAAAAADEQALKERPGYRELDAAYTAVQAGDNATARAQLEVAVVAKPDLLPAWEALAELEFEAGAFADAAEHATACLKLDDESIPCLAVAANAARELGDEEAAAEYMARYREVNPDDPAMLYNEAVEFLNALDDEGARPILEQCLEIDPDFPKCLYEYGLLLLRAGDMAAAKEQFEHYLEVAPDGEDAATVRETVKYL
jgi:tetratricopeptide (TPR) repeat protein